MTQQPELWVGLVEVRPLNGKSYGAAGAFTNIITRACDADDLDSMPLIRRRRVGSAPPAIPWR